MDGQQGGFASCGMLTFYPNEILLIHIGQYTSGISMKKMTPKWQEWSKFVFCNQTTFYNYSYI